MTYISRHIGNINFTFATKVTILFFCLFFASIFSSYAANDKTIPYFAAIKSEEANVRTGPSVRYPIKWTYQRQGWPVEIIASFEQWRKIKDIDGDEGWIHESMLSSRRRVIIEGDSIIKIYRLPITTSVPIALAEEGVIAQVITCKSTWCKVNLAEESGWVEASYLWGIYEGEQF